MPMASDLQFSRNFDPSTGQRYYKGQTALVPRYAAGYGEYRPPVASGSWVARRGPGGPPPRVSAPRGASKLQGLGCSCDATQKVGLGSFDLSTDGPRYFMYGLGALLIFSALKKR